MLSCFVMKKNKLICMYMVQIMFPFVDVPVYMTYKPLNIHVIHPGFPNFIENTSNVSVISTIPKEVINKILDEELKNC